MAFDHDLEALMDAVLEKDERDAKMKFSTKQEAEAYRRSEPFPERHRAVKTTYFDLETWSDKECWTLVFEG